MAFENVGAALSLLDGPFLDMIENSNAHTSMLTQAENMSKICVRLVTKEGAVVIAGVHVLSNPSANMAIISPTMTSMRVLKSKPDDAISRHRHAIT